ncbi:hypothetical protein [Fodinicola acaciae]|uniref:hypothetical protein n=1 Tax=Fodinicola acaciae TaxID=2681555 RepID=UPI001FE30252|nr:hypothetical protein [Fodinicola acaciae]
MSGDRRDQVMSGQERSAVDRSQVADHREFLVVEEADQDISVHVEPYSLPGGDVSELGEDPFDLFLRVDYLGEQIRDFGGERVGVQLQAVFSLQSVEQHLVQLGIRAGLQTEVCLRAALRGNRYAAKEKRSVQLQRC